MSTSSTDHRPASSSAARLRALRERLGLNQSQFARVAGVAHATTVSRWETARSTPRTAHVRAMAESIGVPFDAMRRHIEQGVALPCERSDDRAPSPEPGEAPLITVEPIRRAIERLPRRLQEPTGARRETLGDESMRPEFHQGDTVVASPCELRIVPPGAACLVKLADERVVVRYIHPGGENMIELRPGSHHYATERVRRYDIVDVALVVELRRRIAPAARRVVRGNDQPRVQR